MSERLRRAYDIVGECRTKIQPQVNKSKAQIQTSLRNRKKRKKPLIDLSKL